MITSTGISLERRRQCLNYVVHIFHQMSHTQWFTQNQRASFFWLLRTERAAPQLTLTCWWHCVSELDPDFPTFSPGSSVCENLSIKAPASIYCQPSTGTRGTSGSLSLCFCSSQKQATVSTIDLSPRAHSLMRIWTWPSLLWYLSYFSYFTTMVDKL